MGAASFPISLLCPSFRDACSSLLMVNKRFVPFSLEVVFLNTLILVPESNKRNPSQRAVILIVQ